MKKFFKRLLCKHPHWSFVRNIYGDEINYTNARSVYKCDNCGKDMWCSELNLHKEK